MQVSLIDKKKQSWTAEITEAKSSGLKKLSGWKFDWHKLSKCKKCTVYKLHTDKTEGLMMIQFIEDDFFELKNIEVAPSNYGSEGEFVNAAQILIAYGCLLSFKLNKGPYQGYLSFISKGELINYYIEKYKAELVYRERMYINPVNGIKLIKEHLNKEL